MKKILFIAKLNRVVKELNGRLTRQYRVQLCNYNAETVMGMMEVIEPDLVLLSLIGAADLDTSVYSSIHLQYPETPVFTIGDSSETRRFARYYEMDQFENLDRPISEEEVEAAIRQRLGEDTPVPEMSLNDFDFTPDFGMLPNAGAAPDLGADPGPGAFPNMGSTPDLGGFPNMGTTPDLGGFPNMGMAPEPPAFPEAGGFSEQALMQSLKKNVLVVDDNAGTLRSIKSMLDGYYNVSIVPSGVKAVAMMGKKIPDVIVLDYEMPVVDGRQTLEMIRAEEEFADIPVLFLTSVADREHIQAVLSLNPSGYLLKPPNPDKLIAAIDKALSEHI